MQVHWHRRDFRLADSLGLSTATPDRPVVGLFVVDEDIHGYASPPRVAFVLSALESLREAYRDRGGELLVRHGDPSAIVPDVATGLDASVVTAATDYSRLATRRDEAVADHLSTVDVEFERPHDGVLVAPGTLTTTDGDPYSVFTYYGRKWHDRDHDAPVPAPDESALADPALDSGAIPTLAELDYSDPEPTVPEASPDAAVERLDAFVDGPIYDYASQRDYPAAEGTARLSPHLRFGTVGVRTVYEATADAMAATADDAERESVREFQSQLAWRDFYTEQLAHTPSMVAENLKPFETPIQWQNDERHFAAWTAGETGYPIVDAGMRQLRDEGWLHNRVRMIVASFLTKDLRIDWRWGYGWFRETLVDHDPGNDAGGWQWAASTGTDAQPFFRIFNPTSQAEKFDPDGEYVREYVPELSDVPTDAIHDWPNLDAAARSEFAPDYPAPIVDHAEAREAALAMYRSARGE
jgi:deoxyribodipyrimidine photo-lyase